MSSTLCGSGPGGLAISGLGGSWPPAPSPAKSVSWTHGLMDDPQKQHVYRENPPLPLVLPPSLASQRAALWPPSLGVPSSVHAADWAVACERETLISKLEPPLKG